MSDAFNFHPASPGDASLWRQATARVRSVVGTASRRAAVLHRWACSPAAPAPVRASARGATAMAWWSAKLVYYDVSPRTRHRRYALDGSLGWLPGYKSRHYLRGVFYYAGFLAPAAWASYLVVCYLRTERPAHLVEEVEKVAAAYRRAKVRPAPPKNQFDIYSQGDARIL